MRSLTYYLNHLLRFDLVVHLYQQLGQIVRSSGVFLNSDHLYFPPHLTTLQRLAKSMQAKQEQQAFSVNQQEDWKGWWRSSRKQNSKNC